MDRAQTAILALVLAPSKSLKNMSNASAVPMKAIVDQVLTTVLVRGYRPSTPTALRQAE